MHADRREHSGHPEDESKVVDHDHDDVDRNLRTDRRVGLKVEGAVEHVAQRERARIRCRDGDRHRKVKPAVQTGEDHQIDAESQAIDQTEAEKRRRNDRAEPERKPTNGRLTPLVKSAGQA